MKKIILLLMTTTTITLSGCAETVAEKDYNAEMMKLIKSDFKSKGSQITKEEIAFGTIGPSLYQYGKLRGNSEEIVKYTWEKIYNAQAFIACSSMPRFGHSGILDEQQIKDVMALLLDPASPVNQ